VRLLRQSTASQEQVIGPFVDSTDFVTRETALSIANTDIKLVKGGGTSEVNKNSGGATHIAQGRYSVAFDATDTNTLGSLFVAIDMAGALPVWHEFEVISAEAYDALQSTGNGLRADIRATKGTGLVGQVGYVGIDWGAVANPTTTLALTGTTVSTGQTIAAVSGAVGSVTGAVGSVTGSVGSVTGNVGGSVGSVVGAVGSVTGNVGGNVTGSVGSVATGGITSTSFAANAINAAAVAADAGTEIATAVWANATRTLSAGTNIVLAKGTGITGFNDITAASVWGVTRSGNQTTGTFGEFIDASINSRSTLDAAGVWAAGTRTLTSGANIALAKGTGITGFNDIAATDVWAATTRTLSAGTNIVLAKGTGITGFNDLDAAGIRSAVGLASANLDTQLSNIDNFVDTEVAAIKTVTDKLDSAMELDGGVYRFTINALEQAPSGSGASASAIADAVWDEVLSGHLTAGSTGAALNAAGSSGDPWATTLPGAYGAGTAGNIIGNRIDAAITSRATDAGVWTNGTRTLTSGANIALAKGTGVTGFNDVSASDVWAAATRTLTAGTNIVLAKGTGVTGFNDITAASVWGVARSGNQSAGTFGEYIDASINSRSTYSGADTAGTSTLVARLTSQRASNLDNLDASISSAVTAINTRASQTVLDVVRAQTDKLTFDGSNRVSSTTPTMYPTNFASMQISVGGVVTSTTTLTSGERDAIADAFLDRANAVETGETPRQLFRLLRAVIAGVSSRTGTTNAWTSIFRRKDGTTAALTVSHDDSGSRSSSTTGTL
jgi:hypothetical protein